MLKRHWHFFLQRLNPPVRASGAGALQFCRAYCQPAFRGTDDLVERIDYCRSDARRIAEMVSCRNAQPKRREPTAFGPLWLGQCEDVLVRAYLEIQSIASMGRDVVDAAVWGHFYRHISRTVAQKTPESGAICA